MQAIWLQNQQLSYRTDISVPTPANGEALVKVLLAGICATDLQLINGYYPYTGILGHEFVGEIVQAIDAPERIGERVVGEINVACGKCANCLNNQPTHCIQRTVLGIINRHGAFAEYLCLPLKNLIPVPTSVSNEKAVFTEPLAAALQIQQQVAIRPNHKVLIIGAGRLGQLIAQTLVLTGCDLQVVARYEQQQQLLQAHKIAWILEQDIEKHNFNIVIEATGSTTGFNLAIQAVQSRGIIVLKSTYRDMSANFSSIVINEITLVGSRCGSFAPALRLLENKLVDPTSLIADKFHLSQTLQAFEYMRQPGILKVLLQMEN
ncbi:alcohol dehydrogenase catalytic domain-containing protein [Candidatus Halobeggiatoa sp. HSG11]|nr:alcohol dehydrogenase catalytic domain-containing protein [Candidatus Halobeggiatoa sp. HSG11]